MKIKPPLCLELPGKEAYMTKPAGGAVEIDWQFAQSCYNSVKKYGQMYLECT